MMDRLARIEMFIRVVEEGSFSAAARSLKTTQPTVSKAVAELEQQLKTRLVHRTTRTLSPTEAGAAYYKRVKRLVDLLYEADNDAAPGQDVVRGRLRVNTSALLAGKLVMPAIAAFKLAHPSVAIEVEMDDRRIDLVEHATDVAVRVGSLSDSTLRVRRAGTASSGLFVSPAYLARRGLKLAEASDLARVHFVRYAAQNTLARGKPEGQVSLTVSNIRARGVPGWRWGGCCSRLPRCRRCGLRSATSDRARLSIASLRSQPSPPLSPRCTSERHFIHRVRYSDVARARLPAGLIPMVARPHSQRAMWCSSHGTR